MIFDKKKKKIQNAYYAYKTEREREKKIFFCLFFLFYILLFGSSLRTLYCTRSQWCRSCTPRLVATTPCRYDVSRYNVCARAQKNGFAKYSNIQRTQSTCYERIQCFFFSNMSVTNHNGIARTKKKNSIPVCVEKK